MRTCFVCRDDIPDEAYVLVVMEGAAREVCDTCVERADTDDDLIEHLDMGREGLPEFTGVFG